MDTPVTITKLSAPWGALARGASKLWANPLARRTTIGAAGGAGVGGVGNALFGSRESGDVAQRFGKGMLAGGTLGAAGGAGYNFFKGAPTAKAFSGRTAVRGKFKFKPTQTMRSPGAPSTTPVAAIPPAAAPYKRPGAKNSPFQSLKNMLSSNKGGTISGKANSIPDSTGVNSILDIAPMQAFPGAQKGMHRAGTRYGSPLSKLVRGPSPKAQTAIIKRPPPVAAMPASTAPNVAPKASTLTPTPRGTKQPFVGNKNRAVPQSVSAAPTTEASGTFSTGVKTHPRTPTPYSSRHGYGMSSAPVAAVPAPAASPMTQLSAPASQPYMANRAGAGRINPQMSGANPGYDMFGNRAGRGVVSTPVAAKPRITGRGSTIGSDLDAYPI